MGSEHVFTGRAEWRMSALMVGDIELLYLKMSIVKIEYLLLCNVIIGGL